MTEAHGDDFAAGTLAVRVGAHTGSAVQRDGDWFGAAVNLAARAAATAQRGEILMTEATRSAAGAVLASRCSTGTRRATWAERTIAAIEI